MDPVHISQIEVSKNRLTSSIPVPRPVRILSWLKRGIQSLYKQVIPTNQIDKTRDIMGNVERIFPNQSFVGELGLGSNQLSHSLVFPPPATHSIPLARSTVGHIVPIPQIESPIRRPRCQESRVCTETSKIRCGVGIPEILPV